MGKGDWVRPRRISREQYAENFECIFGRKRLNNEEDAPLKEELSDEEERAGANQPIRRENRERTDEVSTGDRSVPR